jgi:hypothetical protein
VAAPIFDQPGVLQIARRFGNALATSAVVTSIVAIIVACGVFAFVFYALGL